MAHALAPTTANPAGASDGRRVRDQLTISLERELQAEARNRSAGTGPASRMDDRASQNFGDGPQRNFSDGPPRTFGDGPVSHNFSDGVQLNFGDGPGR